MKSDLNMPLDVVNMMVYFQSMQQMNYCRKRWM